MKGNFVTLRLLPISHALRNRPLAEIQARYSNVHGSGKWTTVTAAYGIAKVTYNDLGQAWKENNLWQAPLPEIAREEWERRFRARIAERAVDTDGGKLTAEFLKEVQDHELESWPEQDDNPADWRSTPPEDAADEQMMNWEPDP